MSWPSCDVCGRPMMAGQSRRHGVCDPAHPAYQAPKPLDVGMAASQRSADAKWTVSQQKQVDDAIRRAARTYPTFTADQIWRLLPDGFPVTKGLAARLTAAARAGVIRNTGMTAIAQRGGLHDHAQRLSVWASSLLAEQGTGR